MSSSPKPVVPTSIKNRRNLSSEQLALDQIPVVDLAGALQTPSATRAAAEAIHEACTRIGFFYVRNHGVEQSLITNAFARSREFFQLPSSTKLRYDIGKIKRHRGYVPIGALSADPELIDYQEGYEVGLELPESDPDHRAGCPLFGPNVWPEEVPGFGHDVYAYFDAVLQLGCRLLRLFALGLNLDESYFLRHVNKPAAQLRLLYYPALDKSVAPEDANGVGPHTDYECFTMLYQTEHGLQVQTTDGRWIAAPPIPGTFIINIGDTLQRWTNDLFKSTPHRVVSNTGKARYSMPFFFATDHGCVVRPLESCTSADNPPRYPPTHVGYWIENMHTYSYKYRWHERGKLPNPELVD